MKFVLSKILFLMLILNVPIWTVAASSVHVLQVCDNFNSRLEVGDFARVAAPALNVREAPSTGADRVIEEPLPGGTQVSIIDGPECSDGYTWWLIRADAASLEGWAAEGNLDEYFLSGAVDPNAELGGSNANAGAVIPALDLSPGGGNFEFACDKRVESNIFISDNDYANGATVVVRPGATVLEVDYPAICVRSGANVNATIVSPSGQTIAPHTLPLLNWEDIQVVQVQPPVQAFIEGGMWQIRVENVSLTLDIRLPRHPYVFYTYANGGQLIISGLAPNERILATGKFSGANSDDPLQWFQGQADTRGNYVTSLPQLPWFNTNDLTPTELRLSVTSIDVVGEQGSYYGYKGAAVLSSDRDWALYTIPIEYAAPLMRDIVWSGNHNVNSAQDLLRRWSCPGTDRIRLNPEVNGGRVNVVNEVGIYVEPTTSSRVSETAEPGDRIFINSGVQCANDAIWWEVSEGWIMENQNGRIFLDQ